MKKSIHFSIAAVFIIFQIFLAGGFLFNPMPETALAYQYLIDPPSPSDIKLGQGCITAYHIDEDCDNYGVGDGLLGSDADDNDQSVNTLSSVEAKYGSITSGSYLSNIKNFFCNSRGIPYCNIGNIYFVSPAGNNSTGAVNNIFQPYLTAAYVFVHGFSAGDMILLRAGTYTDYWDLTWGITAKNGYSKTKPNIIAGMPGETAILAGTGGKIGGMNNWYWVFDTIQIGRTDLDTPGDGLHMYGAHNTIFRNLFLPRNGAAMWMQQGDNPTCKETVTVTEDLNNDGAPETRNLTDCECSTDVLIDKMVAYGSGANGATHQFYWGCGGLGAYNNPPVNDPARPTVLANCTIRKLISHSAQVEYEGFQMNGLASNLVIEDSFFHTNDTSGINFLNGVWSSVIRNNVIWNNAGQGIRFNLYDTVWMQPIKDNIIENNTIFVGKNPSANNPTNGNAALSAAIGLTSTSVNLSMTQKGNVFRNNILINYGDSYIEYQPPIFADYQSYFNANFFKNNVFYRTSGRTNVAAYCPIKVLDGEGRLVCSGTNVYYSLSSFQSTFMNSSGNVLSDPIFATPVSAINDYQNSPGKFDFRLLSGSPAINLGVVNGLGFDVLGNTRTGNPDAGAYEYTGSLPVDTIPPASPTGLQIQ